MATISGGVPLGADDAVEPDRFESRHGFGNGRDIGHAGPALRRGDAERAQIAGVGLLQRRRQVVEDQLHLVGHDIGKCDRRAAIGHMHHLDPGQRLEQFRRHVDRGTVARRGIGNLARIGPAIVDQLLHGLDRLAFETTSMLVSCMMLATGTVSRMKSKGGFLSSELLMALLGPTNNSV